MLEGWKDGKVNVEPQNIEPQNIEVEVQDRQNRIAYCSLILQAEGLPLFSPEQRSGWLVPLANNGTGKERVERRKVGTVGSWKNGKNEIFFVNLCVSFVNLCVIAELYNNRRTHRQEKKAGRMKRCKMLDQLASLQDLAIS
jgi:hypothetical protein